MKPSDNTRQLETWKLTYLVLDADRSVEGTRMVGSLVQIFLNSEGILKDVESIIYSKIG